MTTLDLFNSNVEPYECDGEALIDGRPRPVHAEYRNTADHTVQVLDVGCLAASMTEPWQMDSCRHVIPEQDFTKAT